MAIPLFVPRNWGCTGMEHWLIMEMGTVWARVVVRVKTVVRRRMGSIVAACAVVDVCRLEMCWYAGFILSAVNGSFIHPQLTETLKRSERHKVTLYTQLTYLDIPVLVSSLAGISLLPPLLLCPSCTRRDASRGKSPVISSFPISRELRPRLSAVYPVFQLPAIDHHQPLSSSHEAIRWDRGSGTRE